MTADQKPMVSVIVPARNEEACLGSCLESLVSQTGIDFEVIVVDDASTDRTAEIARSFTNSNAGAALLVSAPVLPSGWTGKNNAMSAGAKVAKGKWLLFTDADTVHKPGSLARAVAEAEQNGASLLSYSPEQDVRTFWERALMPVIFAELAATFPPKQVSDLSSHIAAANGQYLLISREAYDAIGGHAKIAGDLLEDVAMARLVKSSGRNVVFRYGGDAVRTRMYRSWAQMKEGWTKNLALLFPRARTLGAVRALEFGSIGLAILGAIALPGYHFYRLGLSAALIAIFLLSHFWIRIRRAHFSFTSNVLALAGLAIFSRLLFRSARLHRSRGVTWKGRTYISQAMSTEQ